MKALYFQIPWLPDLQMSRYTVRFGSDASSTAHQAHTQFLLILQELSRIQPLRCCLRYVYHPEAPDNERLQLFLVIFSKGLASPAFRQQLLQAITSSPLADFYPLQQIEQIPPQMSDTHWVNAAVEVLKKESQLNVSRLLHQAALNIEIPDHYYKLSAFSGSESNDMLFLPQKLHALKQPFILEISLEPTHIKPQEQHALETMIHLLQRLQDAASSTQKELLEHQERAAEDPNAQKSLNSLTDILEHYVEHALFLYSIRLLGTDPFYTRLLMTHFMLAAQDEDDYRLLDYQRDQPTFDAVLQAFAKGSACPEVIWQDYWQQIDSSTQRGLGRLHRLMSRTEAEPFFKLPIPGREPIMGICKEVEYQERQSQAKEGEIYLGNEADKPVNKVTVPLENLKKHMFVVGVPGSGKTTAVMNVLVQLWCTHKIPFMVIEPAKTEYRSLKFIHSNPDELKTHYQPLLAALDLQQAPHMVSDYIKQALIPPLSDYVLEAWNSLEPAQREPEALWHKTADIINAVSASLRQKMRILTLGRENLLPFRFNPFEVPDKLALMEHISFLEAAFRSSIDLGGPLGALLAEAIEEIYYDRGWQGHEVGGSSETLTRQLTFPTMEDLYNKIASLMASKDYDSEIKGNLKSALEVRLGSLIRRSIGRMLNCQRTWPPLAELFETPVVFEMDALNEDQANLMTMLLLMQLNAYVKTQRTSGSKLRHVTMIEEAHNIIGVDNATQSEEVNVKAEATKQVVKMLAEMRALGEGFILADQLPSAVSPLAVKNTNIKLAHRIVSMDDRETLMYAMQLDDVQIDEIARMSPGESQVYQEGWYRPKKVREINSKVIFGIEESPTNDDLKQRLSQDVEIQLLQAHLQAEQQDLNNWALQTLQALEAGIQQQFNQDYFDLDTPISQEQWAILFRKYKEPEILAERLKNPKGSIFGEAFEANIQMKRLEIEKRLKIKNMLRILYLPNTELAKCFEASTAVQLREKFIQKAIERYQAAYHAYHLEQKEVDN